MEEVLVSRDELRAETLHEGFTGLAVRVHASGAFYWDGYGKRPKPTAEQRRLTAYFAKKHSGDFVDYVSNGEHVRGVYESANADHDEFGRMMKRGSDAYYVVPAADHGLACSEVVSMWPVCAEYPGVVYEVPKGLTYRGVAVVLADVAWQTRVRTPCD
jgi:hypothetical protein